MSTENGPAIPSSRLSDPSGGSFNRQRGIFDEHLLATTSVMIIGAGRGVGSASLLAAAGVGHLSVVDKGIVDAENIGQSEHTVDQVGLSKAEALRQRVRGVASKISVGEYPCRAQDIADLDEVMALHDVIKIGVDDEASAFELAGRAQRRDVDAIVVGTQGDNQQFFVAGVFPAGPSLEELLPRVWKGVKEGAESPPFFPSCLVNATLVNVVASRLLLGLLHFRAGSPLPISEVGRVFLTKPLAIGLNGVHEDSGLLHPTRLLTLAQIQASTRLPPASTTP